LIPKSSRQRAELGPENKELKRTDDEIVALDGPGNPRFTI